MQFAAVLLAVVLALPTALAAGSGGEMVRVGLAYGSGALVNANLENNTGYGSGYRMGYFDDGLDFVELARTDEDETQITMVKTQNTWVNGTSYSNSDNGGDVIGCYHVLVESGCRSYEQAAADAQEYRDGFVAWIDGDYQVRAGSYTSRQEAEDAAQSLGGTVAGTSSYAVNVTRTGTAEILFQFDGGDALALGVMPDVTGADAVRTWFKGYRYCGGFRYERIGGGDLTVVNIVDLETYIKGVVPYEMSNSWPLEALKVQAVCARSYAYINIHSGKHTSYHFDVCNTTDCQAYYGAGTNSSSYQANERTDQAVDETAGEYAWYDGQVIEAFYSSSHGGASESVYNVWGFLFGAVPLPVRRGGPLRGGHGQQKQLLLLDGILHQLGAGPAAPGPGLQRLQRHRVSDPYVFRFGERDSSPGDLWQWREQRLKTHINPQRIWGQFHPIHGQRAVGLLGGRDVQFRRRAHGQRLHLPGFPGHLHGDQRLRFPEPGGPGRTVRHLRLGQYQPGGGYRLLRRLRHGHPHRHPGDGERQLLYLPGLRQRPPAGSEPVRGPRHGGAGLHL